MPRRPNYDRDAALGKAVDLFWKMGYHGSSLKQIEDTLDMRPGSIYAAFGNKDALYAQALDRYAHSGRAELREHMAGYDSVIEGLKDYLRLIAARLARSRSDRARACMLVKTLLEASHSHPELAGRARLRLAEVERDLRGYLESAKEQGELRAEVDCGRLARLIQTQIMGLRSMAERDLSAEALRRLGEDLAGLLESYRAEPRQSGHSPCCAETV